MSYFREAVFAEAIYEITAPGYRPPRKVKRQKNIILRIINPMSTDAHNSKGKE